MESLSTFKKIALSFSVTTEEPHLKKASFRVNKKIFATLNANDNRATIKFTETDQDLF